MTRFSEKLHGSMLGNCVGLEKRNSQTRRVIVGYYEPVKQALGLRAESHKIYWAVVQGTKGDPVLVAHDSAAAPVGLDEAPALSWYAQRVRYIVETYKPSEAMIRSVEPSARGSRKEGPRTRLRIEGVLLQTLDACAINVSIGALATISGKLGTQAKGYLDSGDFRGLDLSKLQPYTREAVLVAVAALPST